mgnify:CR=1 FL=1
MTSYNRCSATIRCLKNLEIAREDCFKMDIYLVDSNSSDNTVKKVRDNFPEVKIKLVSRNIFWSKAMNLAWVQSIEEKKGYNFFLWLNNDTYLFKDSLKIIFDISLAASSSLNPSCTNALNAFSKILISFSSEKILSKTVEGTLKSLNRL